MSPLRRSCSSRNVLSYLRCGRVLRTPFISTWWETLIQSAWPAEKQQSHRRIFTYECRRPSLYHTLYSGRFHRKFCESRRKVSTMSYRTVRMISRAEAQRNGSWYSQLLWLWSALRPRSQFRNCDRGRSALQSSVPNTTHSGIAPQDSSRTSGDDLHCTIHCTVEDFIVNFPNHVGKSVQCRTVLCEWYHVPKRNVPGHGTLTLLKEAREGQIQNIWFLWFLNGAIAGDQEMSSESLRPFGQVEA